MLKQIQTRNESYVKAFTITGSQSNSWEVSPPPKHQMREFRVHRLGEQEALKLLWRLVVAKHQMPHFTGLYYTHTLSCQQSLFLRNEMRIISSSLSCRVNIKSNNRQQCPGEITYILTWKVHEEPGWKIIEIWFSSCSIIYKYCDSI